MYFLKSLFLLLFITAAFAQEAALDGTQELTPEEEAAAEDYIHQGKADDFYFENCTEENRKNAGEKYSDLCTQDRYAFKDNWQILEAMIPAVTKVYSTVLVMPGASGGTLKTKPKSEGDKPGEKQDWCRYIPLVGEATNLAYAQIQNSKTQENYTKAKPEARQKAGFESLAKTHENQKKSSHMQVAVYSASAACYTAMLFNLDPSQKGTVIAKAGASALIATFYGLKAKAHSDRAKMISELAKGLPGAGDCNPYTETTCFCNEESSYSTDPGNYQKFCVPEQLTAKNKNNDAYVCADKNGKVDPTCACDTSNSCIDKTLVAGALDFGIAPTIMKDPLAALRPLSKGFGTGNINSAAKRNLAIANQALKNYKPDRDLNLTPAQTELAKQISKFGIPKGVAAIMAKNSGGKASAVPASLSSINSGGMEKSLGVELPNKVAALNQQYESGASNKKTVSRNDNPFGNFKKSGGNNGGVEIDGKYADRATLAAEIHSNPGTDIFKVISNRYQLSGWKQFPDAFQEPTE